MMRLSKRTRLGVRKPDGFIRRLSVIVTPVVLPPAGCLCVRAAPATHLLRVRRR